MNQQTKQSLITSYSELFTRGEIMKAWMFINNYMPLWLEDDQDIKMLREEVNKLVSEIVKWNKEGRPYPGTHATADFNTFPKFILAKRIIEEKFFNSSAVIKLLDIGCYTGVFIKEMAKGNFNCYGVDIHKELMEKLKDEGQNYKFEFAISDNLPFPPKFFDVVTAFDVLEHVWDLHTTVKEMERVCKPGGLIIINVPRQTYNYKDEAFEHLRMFSDNTIKQMWGRKDNFKLELCQDELSRPTSFITYTNK